MDAAIAADQPVQHLADAGKCPVQIMEALRDPASFVRALEELADLYRGETVAVVATAEAIRSGLGWAHAPTETVTVAIDNSGWVVS